MLMCSACQSVLVLACVYVCAFVRMLVLCVCAC